MIGSGIAVVLVKSEHFRKRTGIIGLNREEMERVFNSVVIV